MDTSGTNWASVGAGNQNGPESRPSVLLTHDGRDHTADDSNRGNYKSSACHGRKRSGTSGDGNQYDDIHKNKRSKTM
jgi:hypothetical protein